MVAAESDYPWYLRLLFTVAAWLMNSPWTLVCLGIGIILLGAAIIGAGIWRLNVPPTPTPISTESPKAPPAVSPTASPIASPTIVQSWNTPPSARGGPVGPIFAAEFVQWLSDHLPKPCLVKVTAPQNSELGNTIRWLVEYGGGKGLCAIYSGDSGPPNVDDPSPQTNEPGIVIHSHADFAPAERIAHFFHSSDFNVRVSYRMPPQSPPNLLWIDIGPGSPWK
jgi:hypothetical protein